jgi:hypothetical protein
MELPIEYRWLKAHDFNILTPWYLIEPDESSGIRKEYQAETGLDIIPFARRQDRDDIAGFKITEGEVQKAVMTVHLTWSSKLERKGFPSTRESSDLFDWIKVIMLPESQEWMTEDELEDIIESDK